MNISRRIALVLALAGLAAGAHAQSADWPTKPIRIIVPAPAGGAYDQTIRPLANELALALKQPIVIDNRPGAGNIIGAQAGVSAPPDGYTLTMTGMVNAIAQNLYEHLHFDIVGDFTHIASIGGGPQWVVVNTQSGFNSLADVIERAKKEPGRVNFATSGQGSAGHLLMELLQQRTGTVMTHIPYKGGAPALNDVLAGMVPITVLPPTGAIPFIQSGKLKLIAVSSAARSPDAPQAPTFAELGYPELTMSSWVGLSAPKGTPPAIVEKLSAVVRDSLAKPELVKKLEAIGLTPVTMTSAQYTQFVKSETDRWGALLKSRHIKAD